MAWSTPTTRAAGYVVPHTVWNQDVVDNPIALRAGGIAIASQAANEIPYASSASQLTRSSSFKFDGTTLTIAGQIAFPSSQNASAGANTLDDYEEGTYVPTWSSGGSAPAIGNGTLSGEYIKIGKQVTVHITMVAGNTTTFGNNANAWTFSLPFACGSANFQNLGVATMHDAGSNTYLGVAYATTGGSTLSVLIDGSPATSLDSDSPFAWGNTDFVQISITYVASA